MALKNRKTVVFAALLALLLLCLTACSKGEKSSESNSVIMGSVVNVKTFGKSETDNEAAQNAVLEAIAELDSVISKNNAQADLYMLNQHSGTTDTDIDASLYDCIKITADIYSLSQGKTAVTSGTLTQCWGIDTEEFRLPSQAEIDTAMHLCDDSKLVLTDDSHSITTERGQVINLGSVGKGYACNKAVELIKDSTDVNGAVISVGGSIAVVGTHAGSDVWTVGIRNPYESENSFFATLKTGEAFISTSGSYEKRFEIDGTSYHHILDLTTGYPVENGICSVTVIAPSGLVSDALSTMCFCLGYDSSLPVLEKYNAQAVFLFDDDTVKVTDGIKESFSITNNRFNLV